MSKTRGCIAWFDRTLNPDNPDLKCPTTVIIRVSDSDPEQYYRGQLLAVTPAAGLEAGEVNHRLKMWESKDPKTILYIHDPKLETGVPPEVAGRTPLQHPTFIEVSA
jgi:hypothetical protein